MRTTGILTAALISFLSFVTEIQGQTPLAFSLREAQDYAYQNNFDLRNAELDVQIAKKEVKKNTAIGLPQINASVNYMDNLIIPTNIIPNFLAFLDTTGHAPAYLEMKFGMRYNLSADVSATQLVYSGQYLVGLQTAKAYLSTVRQKMIKDKMDVRDVVSEAYLGYLVVEESTAILDSTFQTIDLMVQEAQKVYEAGLLEDIDRVEIIVGPGLVLYGSGATIAVINVITKTAPAEGQP